MPRGMEIGVVGAGYVGLTSAACLARLGHRVSCVDCDAGKVFSLRSGRVPIAEPGLPELVRHGMAVGRLSFTTSTACLTGTAVVLLCLPTPPGPRGVPDLGVVEEVLRQLGDVLTPGCVVAVKSTVPVGTTARLPVLLGRRDLPAVSNPEFLREGHAVEDFRHPDRIVVGATDERAAALVADLYAEIPAPVVHTDPASAELAKYASNAFLAMKLSYVNTLAQLCERLGADIGQVTRTMGLDDRIGPAFTEPGPGWGGSCLPKDTVALVRDGERVGVDLTVLKAAIAANEHQHAVVAGKVRQAVTGWADGSLAGRRIGVLGLTFKAGTDDVRDSPALAVAERLATDGATLTGHDPGLPGRAVLGPVRLVDDPYLVAKDADAIVVLTGWAEFRALDWDRLAALAKTPVLVDSRNLLDPGELLGRGFRYVGLGLAGPGSG